MIICAAIKINHTDNFGNPLEPLIICGHRHGDCFKIIRHLDINRISEEQGFINHCGVFIDRVTAYREAKSCGQINAHNQWYREDNKVPDELYSEDLY